MVASSGQAQDEFIGCASLSRFADAPGKAELEPRWAATGGKSQPRLAASLSYSARLGCFVISPVCRGKGQLVARMECGPWHFVCRELCSVQAMVQCSYPTWRESPRCWECHLVSLSSTSAQVCVFAYVCVSVHVREVKLALAKPRSQLFLLTTQTMPS